MKAIEHRLLFVAFVAMAHSSSAQLAQNNWCFGSYAGLSFTGGSPVAFAGSAINAFESCTTISDVNGDKLFYTDGETVYGRNDQPMPNGAGMAGSNSSCQGVLIVPMPGEEELFYLFTVPAQIGQTSTYDFMSWSIVDMALNGGNGDVTLKNMPLVTAPTEQLMATYHANGRDIWVLTRLFGTDAWYAYLVTCEGIQPPVISNAGLQVQDNNGIDTQAALGRMDLSSDGSRVASIWNDYSGGTSYLELLDFDNGTGIVSGGDLTTHPSPGGSNTGYGLSFSPAGTKLYWSEYGSLPSQLWQFDLSAPEPLNTGIVVGEANTLFAGLQRGRDGKLYMSRWDGDQFLARVDQPEEVGAACGFVLDGVPVAPGWCALNLSNDWMYEQEPIDPIAWTDTVTCATPLTIALTHTFADPQPAVLWSTAEQGPAIEVDASGVYSVMAVFPCDTLFDTVHVQLTQAFPGELLPQDSAVFCSGEELRITALSGFNAYAWSTGGTDTAIVVMDPGLIWVEVLDDLGCATRDSMRVIRGPCECELFVPNVFTPNKDGTNESFGGVSTCAFDDYELRIFNRWGQEVYSARSKEERWSGGDAPDGVYVWKVRYSVRKADGNAHREAFGMVTLVR